ncbi:uncharacterized protein EI97DRAFT_274949 [Westerdykella ornata]|uniref:Cryptic loci regulator 2 N-terminal domain-containing protein n=1 Tax=Westerdykella ornata TaxID=318751 RepID=A0A6A6JPL2_WESOR|nr:uncharacterized protein EI97DRAFT_274949 [Westerdykella ornata]KAF2277848.1 hypothetical protein EI97DRAFT_274949 [Westerdykella ornata]
MSAGRVIVPLRRGSDGDPTHRPDKPTFTQADPRNYLEKLATLWMQARGERLPGISYVLERLPEGYAVFGRPRPGEPSHVDFYLYGHPEHKKFDSPNRFYPHFEHLMNHGTNIGCPCTVCNGTTRLPINGSPAASRTGTSGLQPSGPSRPGKSKLKPTPGLDVSRVDEQGNPDVYRQFIDKLEREHSLDEAITEPLSMDWRAEQECLPKMLEKVKDDPQYLPRAGEIVLFVRELPKHTTIVRNPKTGHFQLYDQANKAFIGNPQWQAGLVGQTPVEQTVIDDLVEEGGSEKQWNVAYSGVRVEPLPNLNSPDKSLSKHHRYVPLHYTRPFILWKDYLASIPEEEWHPTIHNAITAAATMSLIGKYRFRGTWPEAWIYCHGIFIGHEMLAVGDAARVRPRDPDSLCTDVMIISSIRLKLTNLDLASGNDYDEMRPYNIEAFIFGKAYTTEPSRSLKEWLSFNDEDDCPEIIRRYSAHHPLHPPGKEMMIPFPRVLGRVYDVDSMRLWLQPSDSEGVNIVPLLDAGRQGVLEARDFARKHDRRIAESPGSSWWWADSRAEALDLHTVNGHEVSKYDTERKPKEWRSQIKAILEAEGERDRVEQREALQGQRSLRAFKAGPLQLQPTRDHNMTVGGLSTAGPSSASGSSSSKRPSNVMDLSGEDDEEEDSRHREYSVVSPRDEQKMKKSRIAVVINPRNT